MPFMIRTNVIDNCPEKGTFGTEIVDYFRDTLGYVVCKITKR